MKEANALFETPDSPASVAPYQTLPDVIAMNLAVLFCGINPGLRAVATGHHFEGYGNRFWRVLHLAGFTPHQMKAEDDRNLLLYRCGLTAAVERPTARASQLSAHEFTSSISKLEKKIQAYRPANIAFLGKAAYSAISGRKELTWGRQETTLGTARVWILPNPSGLNRSFSLDALVAAYKELYLSSI